MVFAIASYPRAVQAADSSANYSLVLMGTAVANHSFDEWGGGFSAGVLLPFDKKEHFSLKLGYDRLYYGSPNLHSIDPGITLKWPMGEEWAVWLSGAFANLFSTEQVSTEASAGLGISKRIKQYKPESAAGIRVLLELTATETEPSFSQLRLGLIIDKL